MGVVSSGWKPKRAAGAESIADFGCKQTYWRAAWAIEFEPKRFAERSKRAFASVGFCGFQSDVVDIAG